MAQPVLLRVPLVIAGRADTAGCVVLVVVAVVKVAAVVVAAVVEIMMVMCNNGEKDCSSQRNV